MATAIDSEQTEFRDRRDAGARLAVALGSRQLRSPVVLGLPRGGVPVAHVVADALDAPLDVIVARKVGAPGQPEIGIGAVCEGFERILLAEHAERVELSETELSEMAAREFEEVRRRVRHYRADRPRPDLRSRSVILVDDGLATGVTAEAAVRAVRAQGPQEVILAVPVCAPESARRLEALAQVVCVATPASFRSVGQWYAEFDQTSDEEVRELLEHRRPVPGSGAPQ